MMKIFAILSVSLFSVVAAAGQVAEQGAGRTWISDVTIVSPERLDHVQTGSVLIEDGRIVRVDRKEGTKKPAGATVVSGKGLYLIPGLIDSHVHLASVPGMGFDQMGSHAEMVRAYYRQLPRSYLYYGYTTVVDLGVMVDHQVWNDFREAPQHPDLYDCGEALVFANGYPMSYAPPEVRFELFSNFIYDPEQASSIPPEYKPEAHTPAVDVARVKESGGICVKTFYERGFGRDRNLPVMGADVLAEIRKAATKNGLVLMMHANSFGAQKFAVDGDVDVIAHGMWHWGDLDKETELPDEIKELLDRIAAKKIGYQATFQVLEGERAYFEPDYLSSEAIRKVVPREMVAWFGTPEGQGVQEGFGGRRHAGRCDGAGVRQGATSPRASGGRVFGGQECQLFVWHGYSFGADVWESAGLEWLSGDAATAEGRVVADADLQGRDDQQCAGVQTRFATGDD